MSSSEGLLYCDLYWEFVLVEDFLLPCPVSVPSAGAVLQGQGQREIPVLFLVLSKQTGCHARENLDSPKLMIYCM